MHLKTKILWDALLSFLKYNQKENCCGKPSGGKHACQRCARHKALAAQNQRCLNSSKTLHFCANPSMIIRIVVDMKSFSQLIKLEKALIIGF